MISNIHEPVDVKKRRPPLVASSAGKDVVYGKQLGHDPSERTVVPKALEADKSAGATAADEQGSGRRLGEAGLTPHLHVVSNPVVLPRHDLLKGYPGISGVAKEAEQLADEAEVPRLGLIHAFCSQSFLQYVF